jgi:hypothetical protein
METTAETEQDLASVDHCICAILSTLTITLALWHIAAAETSYSFIGFDAPLPGVVSTTISGVEYKSGQLVGWYTDIHGNTHGWRGNKNSATMVPLLPLAGINRAKWTVGSFRPTPVLGAPPSDLLQGFVQTGTALIPITVPGCTDVYPRALNHNGEVVGGCGADVAWSWKDGVVTPIAPPLDYGGGGCEQFWFTVTGINNAGVIVGHCADAGFQYQQGVYTLLPDVRAKTYPQGINEKGVIFGRACDAQAEGLFDAWCAGFIFKNGVMTFVEFPGAARTEVTAVHPTNGRIWGNWHGSDEVWHAFTATPTPGMAAR